MAQLCRETAAVMQEFTRMSPAKVNLCKPVSVQPVALQHQIGS